MSSVPTLPTVRGGTVPYRRADGTEVRLWIGSADSGHAARFERTWRKKLRAARALDAEWDWRTVIDVAARDVSREVIAVCDRIKVGRLHALMHLIYQLGASRLSPGGDIVYVDMLAVAPWNRVETGGRELKGLGLLCVEIATLVSRDAGLGGVVGLHSLPDPHTVRFYVETVGMTAVRREQTPEGDLLFLETTLDQADALLEKTHG